MDDSKHYMSDEWKSRSVIKRYRQNRQRGHEAIVIHLLKCSEKVEGLSPRLFRYAQKGVIAIGRVPPRSVLYILYIKQPKDSQIRHVMINR